LRKLYAYRAALLPNGKVLYTGGYNELNVTGEIGATVFDPSTGSFSAAGQMTMDRFFHTSTLLTDGTVLIAGSANAGSPDGNASAELYDPARGIFSTTGDMLAQRFYHSATLLADGSVLIAGGENGRGALASAEIAPPSQRQLPRSSP
jgi:hypothetical protein